MSATAISLAGADGGSLPGLAVLGKTAAVLALIIALILLCAYLFRRLGNMGSGSGLNLRVIASTALGNRERVVVVELEDTWLVLGVGNGQVTKLHELPARQPASLVHDRPDVEPGFAGRFARALKQQAGERLAKGRAAPRNGA
ncbi:flagellar biosynthetic protein FliO [Zobellella maritima]|uniref:flagellar biosynthetic protein FliO n=1 Tax=Zobellella maritima TaxID=2059725 RepID=UPI000E309FFA|nr:flagellar biosynthetic protein FliO [Zobellella maritima]